MNTNSHMPKMNAYAKKYTPLSENSCKMLEKSNTSTGDVVIVLVVVVGEEAFTVGEVAAALSCSYTIIMAGSSR